jgi:hypothetical protein
MIHPRSRLRFCLQAAASYLAEADQWLIQGLPGRSMDDGSHEVHLRQLLLPAPPRSALFSHLQYALACCTAWKICPQELSWPRP